ncbi:hypothetical protein ACP4OV_003461 [Aristida adscensionis]
MEFAVNVASCVVGKALSPVVDGFLEAWAASNGLGDNVDAVKLQLLYAQAMLENAQGRELRSAALKELLLRLRGLAYDADDVLDELEYFRIQDELLGTHHAATDVSEAGGCAHGLVLNACHACRAVATKLKLSSGSPSATVGDPEEEDDDDDVKQGCFSGVHCACGRRPAGSSPSSPANQGGEVVAGGCMPKVASAARSTAHAVGKRLSCCFSQPEPADDDAHFGMSQDADMPRNRRRFHCCTWPSKVQQKKHTFETPLLMFDRVEISQKMENIVEQLKQVCAMVSTILHLEPYRTNDIAMHRPQTTPATVEPKLYGRDVQLQSIVHRITDTDGDYSTEKLTVLSFVGPGGIGKTTFTQHVYQEVKSQFHVPIWICVSLNFSANRLAQDILKQIPKVDGEKDHASQEELIEQRFKSKRFLLVLDDIWKYEEVEWEKLISPFRKGEGKGNMIMVTTRFLDVAKQVTSRDDCLIELGRLEQADLLEFFGACIFGQDQLWKGHDEFKEVGRKIVEKLKGSPLAAKTVGRLLRNQPTLQQWRRVLESKEWEEQTNDNEIMPALKLSYDYLPFHLQQCFLYCALFPEDYEFDRNELIQLWIGLDILHSLNPKKSIEDVGHSSLQGLVNYGFLKEIKTDYRQPYYVVHDLLHELAMKVSSEECVSICGSNVRSIQIPTSVRHLSISINDEAIKDRVTFEHYKKEFSALRKRLKVENLRTLLLFGKYHECLFKTFCDLFKDSTTLRAVLCNSSYNVEDLLPNLPKLVHLRYLKIKQGICGRSSLPSAICKLYQLKILDVKGCSGTPELARDISNLRNLQYFLVSDGSHHSGIVEVGKLEHLRELKRFEVKKETYGFELEQLGKLLELQVLGIYNLGNVIVKEEASEINLIQKDRLQELTLDWHNEGTKQPTQEDDILECLKPHSNLQKLWIRGHAGARCPTWLGANLSLESLCLDDVAWEDLPSLGGVHILKERSETRPSQKFMNLKRLELVNVKNLKRWVGIVTSHLEEIIIKGCNELLELSFLDPTSHQLEQAENMDLVCSLKVLEIVDCPVLSHLPSIPWTRNPCSAKIKSVASSFEEINYTDDFRLEIQGKDGAVDSLFWKVLDFDNLTGLKELRTKKCPALLLDHLQKLSSLKELRIDESNTAVWLVENEKSLRYKCPVECIRMLSCNTNGKELTQLLAYCPKLSSLTIGSCHKIKGLCVGEQPMTSTGSSSGSSRWKQQQVEADGEVEEIQAASGAAADGPLLLPPQLEELEIIDCSELRLHHTNTKEAAEAGGGLQGLRRLRSLQISWCPRFLSSSASFSLFPASLQVLDLCEVQATTVPLSNLTSLTHLHIIGCGDLRAEEGLWPLLAHGRLTTLRVYHTPNFFAGWGSPPPPERGVPPRSSSDLQPLSVETDDAAGVLAAPICTLLSSSLTILTFEDDHNLERFTEEQEEALQLLTSLQQLRFWWCDNLQCLPAGLHTLPNLNRLEILGCDALPTSLQQLVISGCSAIQFLPKGGLPSSLQVLKISDCSAIKSLPKDALPSSLQVLEISDCSAIKSLPKDALPSSLQELRLQSCSAIQSLPKDALPSSLQVLEISDCPAIRSLPKVDSLPSSLRELDVRECGSDELRRQCHKLRGIIPIVYA